MLPPKLAAFLSLSLPLSPVTLVVNANVVYFGMLVYTLSRLLRCYGCSAAWWLYGMVALGELTRYYAKVESGNRFDTVATAVQALRTFTLQSDVAG